MIFSGLIAGAVSLLGVGGAIAAAIVVVGLIVIAVYKLSQRIKEWLTKDKVKTLDPKQDKIFLGKITEKLKSDKIKVKNIGIYQGIYNEGQDEITEIKAYDAESLDDETKQTLGNDDIVLLK